MNTFSTIEELKAAEGTIIGESPWLKVTQERIDMFAEATGDHQWIHKDPHQWIHLDAEMAKNGMFGTTVAHGFLSLSLIAMLEAEAYQLENVKMKINYGLNRLRFITPLKVNSKIKTVTKLISITVDGSQAKLVREVTVISQTEAKPILVAETITLLVLN